MEPNHDILPTEGYRQAEMKTYKIEPFRSSKQIDQDIKKVVSRYTKKPYQVKNRAAALRFMIRTFRTLDDLGFFSDPVVVERFKELSANKK